MQICTKFWKDTTTKEGVQIFLDHPFLTFLWYLQNKLKAIKQKTSETFQPPILILHLPSIMCPK